jgi:TRAP-type C4-dicarboxylate transport system permease small subunit
MTEVCLFFGSLFVTIVLTGSIFIFGILFFWGCTNLAEKLFNKWTGGK